MDTLLRGAVLSYNRQEIVRPNLNDDPGAGGAGDRETQRNDDPCAGGASDNSRWEARRAERAPPDGQRGKKHPPRRGGRAYQRQNPPPPLPGRFATRGAMLYRWVRSASPRFPPAIVRCFFRLRVISR